MLDMPAMRLALSQASCMRAASADGLSLGLGARAAPRLAPKPLLREGLDRHRALGIVRQVLAPGWRGSTSFFHKLLAGLGLVMRPQPAPKAQAPHQSWP